MAARPLVLRRQHRVRKFPPTWDNLRLIRYCLGRAARPAVFGRKYHHHCIAQPTAGCRPPVGAGRARSTLLWHPAGVQLPPILRMSLKRVLRALCVLLPISTTCLAPIATPPSLLPKVVEANYGEKYFKNQFACPSIVQPKLRKIRRKLLSGITQKMYSDQWLGQNYFMVIKPRHSLLSSKF